LGSLPELQIHLGGDIVGQAAGNLQMNGFVTLLPGDCGSLLCQPF
jgi:hypothetical protein